ncbi:hypothetical protein [Flammeovirga sp. SJP92]|uniref:hypothetical protein n=1 Tax=Flammeovirga sp. SJP92 TaxID=1775430 RepID=UPI0007883B4B|nr:hypothetical protein [Flammeovirga sp. SJP92]KXX69640.1 hypothetical protein AVL50_15375 [Flammeovirga sp. SJP92]
MDDGSDLMASEYIQSQFKAFHLEQIDNSWTQEFTVHYPVFNSYTLSNQNHTVTIDSLLISIGFEDID